jgi:hypothetical protein
MIRGAGAARWTLGAVFEAPAFVAGFNDFTVMGQPVDKRGGHFGVAKDAWPFGEGEVGVTTRKCSLRTLRPRVQARWLSCKAILIYLEPRRRGHLPDEKQQNPYLSGTQHSRKACQGALCAMVEGPPHTSPNPLLRIT